MLSFTPLAPLCPVDAGVPGVVLDMIQRCGYTGIEASLTDLGSSPSARRETVQRLADRRMSLVCGVYSSWADYDGRWNNLHTSPAEQLEVLADQIVSVADAVSADGNQAVLLHVNAHTGGDGWDEDTAARFYTDAAGMNNLLPLYPAVPTANGSALYRRPTLSYETHRARPLGAFFTAARLCERVDGLRLTLDYSHWVLSSERLVGVGSGAPLFEQRLLDALIERVDHVHARVGSPQSPQLPVDGGPHWWQVCRDAHADVWRRCWVSQARRGAEWVTATPEYGPPPEYTPVDVEGVPLYDSVEQTERASASLHSIHASIKQPPPHHTV